MQSPDPIALFIDKFTAAGLHYCVTGSMASIVYGRPRLTHDVDVVMILSADEISSLRAQFHEDEYYLPPEEILRIEVQKDIRAHFNLIHIASGFKADVYLCGNDAFMKWALETSNTYEIDKSVIRLAPPEYVITKKLEYFSEGGSAKHLVDVKMMIDNSSQIIDFKKLNELLAERDLLAVFQTAIEKH